MTDPESELTNSESGLTNSESELTDSESELAAPQAMTDEGDAYETLALVPLLAPGDLQGSLNPAAAVFVFETKLCPVTYSYHPYTKITNSNNLAIHGLGRPALTLQSTALTQPKVNTGVPRVYQSESRNIFVAEYERFKEVKVNLQNAFPSSLIIVVNFDEWVSLRIRIADHNIDKLKDNLNFRMEKKTAKDKAFADGPVPNYEVDVKNYPKPTVPFPRSIVAGHPPAVTKKANNVYFENWSKIGYLWGEDVEPMPRTYPNFFGQEAFPRSAAGSAAGANPFSPKSLPLGVIHGVPGSEFEPAERRDPGGKPANNPGSGKNPTFSASSSSKTPGHSGFKGPRQVPVPTSSSSSTIPEQEPGYANDHYFKSRQNAGFQQQPHMSNGHFYHSVPPPYFPGGPYPGNQFNTGYYGREQMPQARNPNAPTFNGGHYGPMFNPYQQQQHPGFPQGAQNGNFAPGGGFSGSFIPGGGFSGSFIPGGGPSGNFVPGGGPSGSFVPGGGPSGSFVPGGGPSGSFIPGGGPSGNFIPSGGPNANYQQQAFGPRAQNANFAQTNGHNPRFPRPGFVPGGKNKKFGQTGGPIPGFVPASTTTAPATSAPTPGPANPANASAPGPAQDPTRQQHAITGYAYESDDDYVPEDYQHEGYEGEELQGGLGQEGEEFDGYDIPSSYYHDLVSSIPDLRLDDDLAEQKEEVKPARAKLGEEKATKQQ
ncbi:hypothetical protein L873DRAFT_1815537 [Choiromyces venosus 120613-1]|uniref:Uncharacterized protein n=1 Tax=Choiromyces venosus 120613-1 TaxID=1336337 RepID=A0A3N4J5J2_9PEZI|nr:hypothetical protein L873DRAFT_1815537 [Choiromyces venosus 120613-1]